MKQLTKTASILDKVLHLLSIVIKVSFVAQTVALGILCAGFLFDLIGGYQMQIMIWAGDEEFPPNAQVLYSDNFAEGFAAEDRVVAGDILITAIKSNM